MGPLLNTDNCIFEICDVSTSSYVYRPSLGGNATGLAQFLLVSSYGTSLSRFTLKFYTYTSLPVISSRSAFKVLVVSSPHPLLKDLPIMLQVVTSCWLSWSRLPRLL